MKVLMLGWELPPHNSGGLGVACLQIAKSLAKRAVDIEFVLPYKAHHPGIDFMKVTSALDYKPGEISFAYDSLYYDRDGGPSPVGGVSMAEQMNLYETAVGRLAASEQYDIIHAHDWMTFRAALRAKEKLHVPIILHVHSVERDRAGGTAGNPLVREIEGLSMLLADQVVAVSQHTKNVIVKDYGIPEDKIAVAHNSLNPWELEPLDDQNAFQYLAKKKSLGYRVVANVGRLTVQKGLPNLLYAAKAVIDRAPKTIFLIVGSGEQYYELIELAAKLGISRNVVFTGFLRGKAWRDSYAIADLFVMPSISEPFGLTPLEAIGYGTPALISKQSGVSEVIMNCLKVDFWDINEMANQITAVVQNDSLAHELHRNSYQEFAQLSWDQCAEKLDNLYQTHHRRHKEKVAA